MVAKFLVLLHLVDHSNGNSGCLHEGCRTLQVSRQPYTAGHPDCRTLQVIQTAVYCRSSRLPYTEGHPHCRTLQVSRQLYTAGGPDCRTLQVVQTAVHCRSSTLPYTAGGRTLQVIHTAVHCRSSTLPYTARTLQVVQTAVHCRTSTLPYTAGHPHCPYTAGHPHCRTLQVVQAARQPPHLTQSLPDTCGPERPQSDGVELPLLQCCFTSTQRHYTTHGPIWVHDTTSTSGR